jgi:translocation and assembly module TamA
MNRYALKWIIGLTTLCISVHALAKTSISFNISGIKDPALDNATKRLEILAKGDKKITAVTARKLYAEGATNIKHAIQPYGFFKATVSQRGLRRKNGNWVAKFAVNPGEPLRITKVKLEVTGPGKNDKKIQHVLKKDEEKKIKVGEIFNVPAYQKERDKLLFEAQKRGYIKAKMTVDKIKINLITYTCQITIIMDTNARYYFGTTTFEKSPLNKSFLHRFIHYKRGKPFSSDKLLALQSSLGGAGYFKGASVTPLLDNIKNYTVPVHVNLTPNKRKLYEIGLGYGTVSGPRMTAGINWRWTNAYGHYFKTNMMISKIDQNIQAQYIIPAKHPATDQYVLSAGIFTLQPGRGTAFVKKIGVGYQSQRGRWKRNLNLSYILERYRIDKSQPTRNANMLAPSLAYEWTSVTNIIRVKNGSRLALLMQGSWKPIISSVTFLQGEARFKTIQTFFKNNRIILRTDIGYTLVKDSDRLPLSVRFYTGGPSSIRGYADQGIGPGRYLTVYSAEYQRRIVGDFYGAVFYDLGNAFKSYDNYFSNLQRGAGIGAVWQTMLGDVSVYVAKALSKKGHPIRFMFSLGAEL